MKTRILWMDSVRSFAIILVVLLHTAAPYLYRFNQISELDWNIGNLVDSFSRVGVPLFFMISGALFYDEKSPRLKHYLRILAALIFYSILGLLYLGVIRGADVRTLLKNIWAEPVIYHLWFFYRLMVVYLVAGLVSTRNLRLHTTLLFSVLCFLALNPRLSDLTQLIGIKLESKFQIDGIVFFYILYAILGSVLGRIDFEQRPIIIFILPLLYIVSSLSTAFLIHQASFRAGKFIDRYYEYNSVFVFTGAFSVFTLFKMIEPRLRTLEYPIRILAKYSLPIYGVHALLLDFITQKGFMHFKYPVLDISLTFITTLAFSLLVAVGIKKFDKYNWVS